MGLLRIKTPIEYAFYCWINNYPESYHSADMDRFYKLVKTVKRFSREAKGSEWLRRKIRESKKQLNEEDIDHYCDLFVTLLDYDKAYPMQSLELTTDLKRVTRLVVEGKLIEREGI